VLRALQVGRQTEMFGPATTTKTGSARSRVPRVSAVQQIRIDAYDGAACCTTSATRTIVATGLRGFSLDCCPSRGALHAMHRPLPAWPPPLRESVHRLDAMISDSNVRRRPAIMAAVMFGLLATAPILFYLPLSAEGASQNPVWLGLRLLVAYLGAIVVGYLGRATKSGSLWFILCIPPLALTHVAFLVDTHGPTNLWPPLLFIDVVLFLVCFPLLALGKRLGTKNAASVN